MHLDDLYGLSKITWSVPVSFSPTHRSHQEMALAEVMLEVPAAISPSTSSTISDSRMQTTTFSAWQAPPSHTDGKKAKHPDKKRQAQTFKLALVTATST